MGCHSVDDLIITDELDRRPSRAPDHQAENNALARLAHELTERPETLLQALTDLIVEMGIADSAGVSILAEEEGGRIFRWEALSGAWKKSKGSTMPFDGNPCAVVIGKDAMLLLGHPQRAFPDAHLDPLIHEMLLVPLRVEGEPVGTVCINAHRRERKLNGQDARLLTRLADFASAGYRTIRALKEAKAAKAETERSIEALRESEERHRFLLREATAELKASRDLLQGTMDASTDMIQVFEAVRDDSGEIVDFKWVLNNHRSEQHYGDVIGESLIQRNPGVTEEGIFDAFKRVMETGEAETAEHHYVHEQFDGWFLQSVVKLDDGVATTKKDISDWKGAQGDVLRLQGEVAEAKLRESEERFRLIVENATDYAILITDPEGIITDWLPGAEAVFGWTAEEAIGRESGIVFTPQERAKREPEKEIETAAQEGFAPDVRWHQRKDGSHVFIEGTVTPLRAGNEHILGYLKIGQDVSERRAAQEALESSERRMRALATGIPQLVFRSHSDGHRIWGSPQWIDYTGLSFEESLGMGWLEKVYPGDRETTMEAWEGVEERGEYYVEHRIWEAATGEWRWHQTRATPVRGEDDRILEWLGTSTNVEDMRRLQRHQQILLGELQHRVRNTLGMVRSIARRTAETCDTVEEMASHLAGRLDAFSRVQSMAMRDPESGISLAALVEDELLAHAARQGEHLKIRGPNVALKPKPAETVSLALHELATNAVKYGALSDGHGRIAVEWRREIRDSGEWLTLDWKEGAVDLDGAEPTRQGFGLELLTRMLPYDLKAETDVKFTPHGLHFALAIPLGPDVLAE
jgi:PAS domain S-box-containing protein